MNYIWIKEVARRAETESGLDDIVDDDIQG